MISIDMSAVVKLEQDLAKLDKEIEITFSNVLKETAEVIKEEAKRVVPVRTGKLRNSINVLRLADLDYSIGSDLDYAEFIERGTFKMDAQPFMVPASIYGESYLLSQIDAQISTKIRGFENGGSQ